MIKCQLCNNSLYQNISFQNIFDLKYFSHKECVEKLSFNKEEILIPIDSNVIIFDFLLYEIPKGFNESFIEIFHYGNLLKRHLIKPVWSIMIFLDIGVEYFITNYNPYLLLNLTNYPILFLSLTEREISIFEDYFY